MKMKNTILQADSINYRSNHVYRMIIIRYNLHERYFKFFNVIYTRLYVGTPLLNFSTFIYLRINENSHDWFVYKKVFLIIHLLLYFQSLIRKEERNSLIRKECMLISSEKASNYIKDIIKDMKSPHLNLAPYTTHHGGKFK